jgi:hypothetical protein
MNREKNKDKNNTHTHTLSRYLCLEDQIPMWKFSKQNFKKSSQKGLLKTEIYSTDIITRFVLQEENLSSLTMN